MIQASSLPVFSPFQQRDASLGKGPRHTHGLQWPDALLMVFCSCHWFLQCVGGQTPDKPIREMIYVPHIAKVPFLPTLYHEKEVGDTDFTIVNAAMTPST